MKKLLSMSLSMLLIVAMITACSSNSSNSSNSSTTKNSAKTESTNSSSGKPITVSLWVLDEQTWFDGAIEDFKQAHPEINVEISKYATDPLKESLKVAASSNSMPNLWFNWGGSLGSFYAENGLTADLSEIAKERNWSEIYNQAALDMATFDGKLSGIPYHLNSVDMWYYKPIFEELGLSTPQSFEEFEALLPAIKEAGYTPLAFGGKYGWHIMRLLEQLIEYYGGAEVHDQLSAMETPWTNEAVVKAFTKLKEYADNDYFPKGFVSLDQTEIVNNYFYPGKAAIDIEGPWLDSSITAAGFDVADFGVFKFPTQRASVFAEMFQVKGGLSEEELEATLTLGEYLTSKEVINKYIDDYGTPATLNVSFSENTPNVEPLLDMATNGGFLILDQALPQEVIQKVFEAQDKVAFGEWTPEQAGEEIEKAVQAYKSKN